MRTTARPDEGRVVDGGLASDDVRAHGVGVGRRRADQAGAENDQGQHWKPVDQRYRRVRYHSSTYRPT